MDTDLIAQALRAPMSGDALEKPKHKGKPSETGSFPTVYDFQRQELPKGIREQIEAHLAMEAEDARSAGKLGFMARAFTLATMPHRDPKTPIFSRTNGDFSFTMMSNPRTGLPYGSIPRLLVSWVSTEAVRTKERRLHLGESLAEFLRSLDLYRTGGKRGDITRLRDQMRKLFASHITVDYSGPTAWAIEHIQIADRAVVWWDPKDTLDAGIWNSTVDLSEQFFKEITEHPIPIDLRAMASLKGSAMALDIYTWLTYRFSYLRKRTTIPWHSLQGQFGSGYQANDQGLRDFKKNFLATLVKVKVLYPEAKVVDTETGLLLQPSLTHVPSAKKIEQGNLF